MLTPNDVFTPGKLPIRPSNVYASRGEAQEDFEKALRRGLIPVVFGEYGVGKTSMARYVLRQKDNAGQLVNIESVADKTLSDIFERCLEKLGYSVITKRIESDSQGQALEESIQAEAGIAWFKSIIASKKTKTSSISEQTEEQFVVTSPTDSRIIELCEKNNVTLLIDELHKATEQLILELTKFIKAYGNASCHNFNIVLLGTSSDASHLVKYDPGIDRLIQEIHLKAMTEKESAFVVEHGMHELSISCDSAVVNRIVKTSVGSPSILQYLCLEAAEAAYARDPRTLLLEDVENALKEFVERKEARLYRAYKAAVETMGDSKYRKNILRAMSECEDEYVTMDDLRVRVSTYLNREVPSTALSGPLRSLKEAKYGPVLSDVLRPDGAGRLQNYTTFIDPALKAFIRLQHLREVESAQSR